MSERVRIHHSIVDFQEQTISRDGRVLPVQGKVLQVLSCLMAQQGQLVSIDTLMQQVWGQTVVSPNTLQRCIAQLRKAFGESSQTQNVIKTYPKRGYALIVPVLSAKEHQPGKALADDPPERGSAATTTGFITKAPLIPQAANQWRPGFIGVLSTLIITIGLALVTVVWQQQSAQSAPLPQLQLQRQLTASAQYEDHASYSPDQRWIAFERFESFCHSTVWLQQRRDKSELQLTLSPQQFSGASWSTDSTKLAVISNHGCIVPHHPPCWQVDVIALNSLQPAHPAATVSKVGGCEHQPLSHPVWRDDQQLLLLRQAKDNGRRHLVLMSPDNGQLRELFSHGDLLTFVLQPDQTMMAIAHTGSGHSELLKISQQGELLSRQPLDYQQQTSAFNQVKLHLITIAQNHQQLVLESDGQLFLLQPDGTLRLLPTPAGLRLSRFAISRSNAAATLGGIDLDIIHSDWQANKLQTLQRSPAFESQARLSPVAAKGAQQLAFVSDRSGQNQIWLVEGATLRQLSHFDRPVKINGLIWARQGQSVLANVNDSLYQFALDGQSRQLASPVRIKYLHQAVTSEQLLIEYQHEFQEILALYQPATGQLTPLHAGQFDDARLDQHGTLWFSDANFQLYQLPASARTAQPLVPEVTVSAFTIANGVLLATTKDGRLLQLDLQTQSATFKELPKDRNLWISDADATQILFNQKQTMNTDLVEFNW